MSLKRLRLQPKKGDSGSYAFDSIIAYKAVFRLRVFFPDPDQTFFFVRIRIGQKSGSDPEKSGFMEKRHQTRVKVEKMLYFISSTLNPFLFGQAPPNP